MGLQSEAGELRAKLEESKKQLTSNEQMIRWLNQQVCLCGCMCICGCAQGEEGAVLSGMGPVCRRVACRLQARECKTPAASAPRTPRQATLPHLTRPPARHALLCPLPPKQVTAAQLQGAPVVPGSRYQFMPSASASALLTTPAPGGGAHGMLPATTAPSRTFRYNSPVDLQCTAASKLGAGGAAVGTVAPYSTTSFSPKTVTPLPGRGDYGLGHHGLSLHHSSPSKQPLAAGGRH